MNIYYIRGIGQIEGGIGIIEVVEMYKLNLKELQDEALLNFINQLGFTPNEKQIEILRKLIAPVSSVIKSKN